jgi:hypothetical protein
LRASTDAAAMSFSPRSGHRGQQPVCEEIR